MRLEQYANELRARVTPWRLPDWSQHKSALITELSDRQDLPDLLCEVEEETTAAARIRVAIRRALRMQGELTLADINGRRSVTSKFKNLYGRF